MGTISRQAITIADVARVAGVSTATVSRVLNQSGQVIPTTQAKVLAVVEQLGYQPNQAARVLASNRTRTIGVLIDELGGESSLPLLRGIQRAISEYGYEFLVYPTRYRIPLRPIPVNETNTDGLIVFANSLNLDELERIAQQQFPLVLLARTSPAHLELPYVTVENEHGAYQMGRYLLDERGYRQFAFLRGELDQEDSQARERGYRRALAESGLSYEAQLIGAGEFCERTAYQTVQHWLRAGHRPQVVVAFDDDSAIGAIAALRAADVQVPQQIAVVGFDDIRLAQYFDPPLTTVRVPIEQVAVTAVEQVIGWIESGSAGDAVTLAVDLAIRRSCGA